MKALIAVCLLLQLSVASAATKTFFVKTQAGSRDAVIAALVPLGFNLVKINTTADWITVRGPDKIEDLRQVPNVLLVEAEKFYTLEASSCPDSIE